MKFARVILYLITLATLIGAAFFYRWIGTYLILSVIFAYILNPWVSWLERKGFPRVLAVLTVYLFFGAIIAWGIIRILPLFIDQAQNLITYIKSQSVQGEITLMQISFIQNLQHQVAKISAQVPILKLNDIFVSLVKSANQGLMNIPNLLLNNYQKILEAITLITTVPLIGFFLLKDNARFKRDFISMIPNRYFEIVIILLNKIDEIVGNYLRALFYEVSIVGTLSSIVLSLLGVKYGILIGLVAGLTNIIPYFGPIMGIFFAVSSILIFGSPAIMIIYVIIAMYLIQVIDNNIVYPLVVGTTINMHPLFILLTVLAGGWAGGLVGMLVSVPLVYLVYGILKVLFINLRDFEML